MPKLRIIQINSNTIRSIADDKSNIVGIHKLPQWSNDKKKNTFYLAVGTHKGVHVTMLIPHARLEPGFKFDKKIAKMAWTTLKIKD